MDRKNSIVVFALAAAVLSGLPLSGGLIGNEKTAWFLNSAKAAEGKREFVLWQDPRGLLRVEVPAGWKIDGAVGPAMDLGQFKVQGFSPDGRSLFSFAHNWLSFMEFQYGPYRPGHATIESFVLPQFLQEHPEYTQVRIVYRSPNRRLLMPNPMTGMGIPFDHGLLGLLLQRSDGSFSTGMAFAETVYIPSPGTPGLWRMRLFAAAVAPADEVSQRTIRGVLDRVVSSLKLSEEFFALWHQEHARSLEHMRTYSAQMDRVFHHYLRSAGRSSSKKGGNPLDGWATMMRGGEYAENPKTGEQYWVSNDHEHWFVNDRGDVVGNDTGEVPTYGENWHPLTRVGP